MIEEINIRKIKRNPHQERVVKDNEPEIIALAESIREEAAGDGVGNNKGLIQIPDVVSIVSGSKVENILVAGERRLLAFKYLDKTHKGEGWNKIPVNISKVFSDEQKKELDYYLWSRCGKENSERLPLKPIEKALALKKGVEKFGLTLEKAGKPYGIKSRGGVKNLINLLELPMACRELINNGKLTVSHGKALYSLLNSGHEIDIDRLAYDWAKEKVRSADAEEQVRIFIIDRENEKEENENFSDVPSWVNPPTNKKIEVEPQENDQFEYNVSDDIGEITTMSKNDTQPDPPPTMHTPNPPCPKCNTDHIAGTNGGERWCLDCGATWPNIDELNNEINSVNTTEAPHLIDADDTVEVLINVNKVIYSQMINSGQPLDDIVNEALRVFWLI
jgi:ParB family chromosome partitioning protein